MEEMSILVTGAAGFIGKNLVAELQNRGYRDILQYDRDNTADELRDMALRCDFVFHLAGVNRPREQGEFWDGNRDAVGELTALLKTRPDGKKVPVALTSSIQAERPGAYGESKRAGEALVLQYSAESGAPCFIYRLPNVFGKWCRPNYNSAVATFAHNLANDLPITVNDRATELTLVYIDDVVAALIDALEGRTAPGRCEVAVTHTATLGQIVDALREIHAFALTGTMPDLGSAFVRALYATYLSYLPPARWVRALDEHRDVRGSFAELLRCPRSGQISVIKAEPGHIRGNHWHHTKIEKFLVLCGAARVAFRQIHGGEVIDFTLSGEQLQIVDVPVGYTHSIEAVGGPAVILVWADELFDPARPDTYFCPVELGEAAGRDQR